ncbi:acyltransferase [Phaeobacter sp. B1627]|uniref:acyltransferase family protein n=1 Tax=Phaeobacter sp. B1627 TaxID=2583809 RepID=UPI0021028149|nr:acyltransferase [Phaeobacter sp. B1627]
MESRAHDILRMFLLLQVILGHMAHIALPNMSQLFNDLEQTWPEVMFRLAWRFGPQAAFLFVFLSGFMVAGPLIEHMQQGRVPAARDFFKRRMLRIAPIAIGAILLTAGIDALSRLAPGAEALYRQGYAYDLVSTFTLQNFFGNLLFFQPIFVDSFGSNGPLWTLGYIVQYYILGWIFCWAFARIGPKAVIGLVAALVLMSLVRAEWAVLFIAWLAGGLTRGLGGRHSKVSRLCLIAAGVLFVLSNLLPPLMAAVASIPVGMLLAGGALPHVSLPSWSTPLWLRRLSNESYTIYAIHHPVLVSTYVLGFQGHAGQGQEFALYVATSGLAVALVSVLLAWGARKAAIWPRDKQPSPEDSR